MITKSTLVCTKCGLEKLTEEFSKRESSKSGFRCECKACEKVYREKNKKQKSENNKKWRKENSDKSQSYESKRRSKKLQACPPWFNKDHKLEIEELFAIAKERTEVTMIIYQIDHIHPLNNKYVCGLHLPCNLQILSAKANGSKSNKFKSYVESQINYRNPWEINY